MSPKIKIVLGIIGALFILSAVILFFNAQSSPKSISYELPTYQEPAHGGGGEAESLFQILYGLVTCIAIQAFLGMAGLLILIYLEFRRYLKYYLYSFPIIAIFLWLSSAIIGYGLIAVDVIVGITALSILIFFKFRRYFKYYLYSLTLIATFLYPSVTIFGWVNSRNERNLQRVQFGTQAIPSGPSKLARYIAFAEISGPQSIQTGSSDVINIKVWADQTTSYVDAFTLEPGKTYTVSVKLQAINFEMDEKAITDQTVQLLSLEHPATWAYVITPKESKLGNQTVLANIYVEDSRIKESIGTPYMVAKINVTDPLGLPPGVVYGGVMFGGILSLPFWSWIISAKFGSKR